MAFFARRFAVLVYQSEVRARMSRGRKGRGLESSHLVAGSALASIGVPRELAQVIILLVAIHALGMGHSRFIIAVQMARLAGQAFVLSLEGILRCGMVEDRRYLYRLPVLRRMALVAGLSEGPLVRIVVAGRAVLECNLLIPGISFRIGFHFEMAFLTNHLCVRPGEGESRLLVVEPGRILPTFRVVTTLAVGRQLPMVLVGVAANAFWRNPQVGSGEILYLDFGRRRGCDA